MSVGGLFDSIPPTRYCEYQTGYHMCPYMYCAGCHRAPQYWRHPVPNPQAIADWLEEFLYDPRGMNGD